MKNLIFIGLVLVVTLAIVSYSNVDPTADDEAGIAFYQGTMEEAIEKAKKENKLVFLDVYATWCGPCKAMKVRTFTDHEVGDFYNQHFINLSVDGEKSEGRKLIRKYGVSAYPSLIFVDGEGDPVAGVAGYHNSKQLLKLGEQVLNIKEEN